MARSLHHGRHFDKARPPAPTRDELLAPVKRWTLGRKVMLLAGLQNGVITVADVMKAHDISGEELDEIWPDWRRVLCERIARGGQSA